MIEKERLLLVLEGNDGAGKSLQVKLIREFYEQQNKSVKLIHFPMYGHNMYSEMISKFLKGEYGSIGEVDPIFVANIYAMDRYMYKNELLKDLDEYDVVIMDRYVHSNMAYQGAKRKKESDRLQLIWEIYHFEFDFLNLPYPDLVLFFDVPVNEIERRLNLNRKGDDRDYLDGKQDIHEKDIDFQSNVRNSYLLLNTMKNFKVINAYNEKGILTPNDLFISYKNYLKI